MASPPTHGTDKTMTGDLHVSTRSRPTSCEAIAEEVRARGLADLADLQQEIDRAKRTLWALTAAARREPARIEATLADIHRLERAQRDLFTRNIEAWMAERCAQCRSGSVGQPGQQIGAPSPARGHDPDA